MRLPDKLRQDAVLMGWGVAHKSHYRQQTEPFEVPDGWALVKVRDVCVFDSGFAFSSQSYKPCGTPLIRISNISDGNISLDDCVFVEPIRDSRYVVQKGDLLIAMSGATTGKMGIYDKDYPAMLNQRVGNVKTISESVLLSGYRDLFFKSLQSQILQDAYGGAQPNISAKNICDYDLLLPPINEQVRIIKEAKTYLQLLEVVENSTAKLDDYTSRVKSRILQMAISGKLVPQDPSDEPAINLLKRINPDFVACDKPHYPFEIPNGWQLCTIGDLFRHNTGKALNASDRGGNPFRYITTSNLYWDRFDMSETRQMLFKDAEIEKCQAQKGDLLVCEGGDIGRAAIWTSDAPIMIQNHIHKLRPKASICTRLYLYIFMLYKGKGMIGGKGIGLLGLSSRELDRMVIPVPPIEEQYRITNKIDTLFSILSELN